MDSFYLPGCYFQKHQESSFSLQKPWVQCSFSSFLQARAFGFMETYIVAESEDGQWGHVHFTGPEGYEVGIRG